eukprot:4054280-Lingulodinium_polyedra.AAC.1
MQGTAEPSLPSPPPTALPGRWSSAAEHWAPAASEDRGPGAGRAAPSGGAPASAALLSTPSVTKPGPS